MSTVTEKVGPVGDDAERVRLIRSIAGRAAGDRRLRVVLDTDTYNEIDDQFALVDLLLSRDRVDLEAIYAAPFHNRRSESPADGMRKSYEEIGRVLGKCGDEGTAVFEGATDWLSVSGPSEAAAVQDLVSRAAIVDGGPLYVVAIGAPTNISSALMVAPEIAERVVVVWLGGNALWWPTASEFNLRQDLRASQVLFDSGVALVHVPCFGVTDHLTTTREEIDRHVRPAGEVGQFLADRFDEYVRDEAGVSKVIWDLGAVSWLLDAAWAETVLKPSPVLTEDMTWSVDERRHLIGEVVAVDRDAMFGHLFRRLTEWSQ